MKKRMNKKGQELSITTLVLLILAVIVLVIIVLGFWKGWDFIFGKIGLLPGQTLQVAAKSCEISAGQNLQLDYCYELNRKVKIAGETQYVNCKYIKEKYGFEGGEDMECNESKVKQNALALYTNLKLKDSIKVNGNTKSEWEALTPEGGGDCLSHAGSWNTAEICVQYEIIENPSDVADHPNEVCCITS